MDFQLFLFAIWTEDFQIYSSNTCRFIRLLWLDERLAAQRTIRSI